MNIQCGSCGTNISRWAVSKLCLKCYNRRYQKEYRNRDEIRAKWKNFKHPLRGTRHCSKCLRRLPIAEFYMDSRGGIRRKCRECWQQVSREWEDKNRLKVTRSKKGWYLDNREAILLKMRTAAKALKDEVISAYGGKCACCKEFLREFLTIDHPENNGAEHRRFLRIHAGGSFYKWLKANKFPKEYRVLCFNCNFSMGRFGYCPHGKVRQGSAS